MRIHWFDGEPEQFWKTVIDTMLDGLLIVDPEGIILAVNQAMEELSGYRREELVGRPCTILKCHLCLDALTSGRCRECELFIQGFIRRRQCTMEQKDGTLLHVLKNAAVLKDRTGKVVAGVENFTNLSEVVAKERVISHLRQELSREGQARSLPEKSPDMMQLFISTSTGNSAGRTPSTAPSASPVMLQLYPDFRAAIRGAGFIYGESGTGKELVAAPSTGSAPAAKGPSSR